MCALEHSLVNGHTELQEDLDCVRGDATLVTISCVRRTHNFLGLSCADNFAGDDGLTEAGRYLCTIVARVPERPDCSCDACILLNLQGVSQHDKPLSALTSSAFSLCKGSMPKMLVEFLSLKSTSFASVLRRAPACNGTRAIVFSL